VTQPNPAPRPRPILAAFRSIGALITALGSVATALAGVGILSAAQDSAVVDALGVIPGVITAVTGLVAAFRVVRRAEPAVTPLSDPQDDAGHQLVPVGTAPAEPPAPPAS
jgi:hypothetical protein